MSDRRMVTLDDVAREAGVSVSTASRTLNGRVGRVGADTQERIRAVARRLGYATNLAAQATALGRSNSIGLVVGGIPEDYQNPVMAGVFRSASSRDMLVTTAVTSIADADHTRHTIRRLRGQRPSVLIVVGTEAPESRGMSELIEELGHVEAEGGRVVLIGLHGTPFDCVVMDDYASGYEMGERLASMGYRDVVVVAGSGPGQLSRQRSDGFRQAFQDAGSPVPPDRVIWQEFNHDGGYRAVGEALRREPVPEAIFCVNDAMAIGASVRVREQGLVVGTDIAIAGCDDIPALRDIDPPLTTIHLPWIEAAEHALSLAEHDGSAGRVVTLRGYSVIRRSTPGTPPKSDMRRASP